MTTIYKKFINKSDSSGLVLPLSFLPTDRNIACADRHAANGYREALFRDLSMRKIGRNETKGTWPEL